MEKNYIEELKKEIEQTEMFLFYLDMKDRWDSKDFENSTIANKKNNSPESIKYLCNKLAQLRNDLNATQGGNRVKVLSK